MPKIQTYTNLGSIATGDKLLGERVDGTTVRFTYAQPSMSGTADRITVTSGVDSFTFNIASSYIGQNTITTLGTVTTGVWNGSVISVTYGGSGVASHTAYGVIVGGTTSTGAEQTITPGTANTFFMSGGASAVPLWSTSTIPASAGATANKPLVSDGTNYVMAGCSISFTPSTAGKILKSDGTNWITSTTTMPDTGTLNKILIGDGTNYVESTSTLPTSAGATANKHLKSDGTNYVLTTATFSDSPGTAGKIFVSDGTNWITSTPTFPNTSATARKIIVADGTNWVASTETYAVPGSAGNLLRSDGTNWTAAKATLTTDVTGVLPVANGGTNASSASITAFNNITGYTAAGATGTTSTNLVFSASPTLTGTSTFNNITFSSTSGITGTTTNDSAAAGSVGQVISSFVDSASAVSLTSGASADVTSISLTAGDWNIFSAVATNPNAATTTSLFSAGVNTTSATLPTFPGTQDAIGMARLRSPYAAAAGASIQLPMSPFTLKLNSTTTVYLVINVTFAVNVMSGYGAIIARRVR